MSTPRETREGAGGARSEVTASGPAPRVAALQRHTAFADPVVRKMAWVAALVVVAFLATVVSALFFGIINPPAPRTAMERDLAIAEARIESAEATLTSQDWYTYANALVSAGQYSKAERTIETAVGSGLEDPSKQYFGLVKTRLAIAREDFETALEESEIAMTALEAQMEVERQAYEATGKPSTMIADGLGENYQTLQLLRAEAFEALGRYDEAIAELDAYLEKNARAADILVWRGDLKAASGDREGARADYNSASTYLPGDQALAGKLADLGASND